jgi:hypothetical protein
MQMKNRSTSGNEHASAAGEEALDAFMQSMQSQSASEEVAKLELQLRLTHEQVKQAQQLVEIADPSGEHQARLKSKNSASHD